mmetsp:Transcript_102716/g.290819  ORF Transcript_102716/g.290819 Transcript_102716/m.290819 type:complete len:302 (-) Transcript_102716:1255-2160(-)
MVVHRAVLPVLEAVAQEAELRRGVVVQDILHHVVLQEEPPGDDEVRRTVRGVDDVDARGKLVEEGQRLLDHGLEAVPLLQVVPYLVDQQPQDGVLVLEAQDRGQALAHLLLHHLLGVLADVDLPELFQEVQVRQLQALGGGALRVCQVHEPEDAAGQLAVDDVRGGAVRVGAARLRGSMAPDESAHHVHDPRHLCLEHLLGHRALLPEAGDFLKVFHDVLRRVLVPASPKVREHLELLGAQDLILQRVVPVTRVVRVGRRFRHEEARLYVRDGDLLDVGLQLFRCLVLQQDHRANHRGPKA